MRVKLKKGDIIEGCIYGGKGNFMLLEEPVYMPEITSPNVPFPGFWQAAAVYLIGAPFTCFVNFRGDENVIIVARIDDD